MEPSRVSEGGLVRLRHGSWSGDWGADRFGQAPVHVYRSIATPRSSPIGRPAVGTGLKRNIQRSKQDRKEPPIGDCSDKFDQNGVIAIKCLLAPSPVFLGDDPVAYHMVSAGSVAEVVELLAYLPVITTALSPTFHSTERGLTIGLTGRTGDAGLNCLAVTYGGLALLRLLELLVGAVPNIELHSESFSAGVVGSS